MPRLPIDYSKTIIYKIVCNDLNICDVYVGSTTDFIRRKGEHKKCCNNEKLKSYNYKVYQTIRQNGGWDNFTMVEVEKYPCLDSNEARTRERHYYELLNAKLNMVYPIRNIQEYREDNKEKIKQYRDDNKEKIKQYIEDNKEKIKERLKKYKELNKEVIKEKTKQYNQNNKDKIKQYYEDNKEKILDHRQQYREANKEKIKKYSEDNKEKKKEYMKKYREANKEKIAEQRKQYREAKKQN